MSLARALEGYLVPLLWLLDVSAEDAEWERLDPPLRRQRLREGLRRLLLRLHAGSFGLRPERPSEQPRQTVRLAEAALFVYDPARPSRYGHSIKCWEADRV